MIRLKVAFLIILFLPIIVSAPLGHSVSAAGVKDIKNKWQQNLKNLEAFIRKENIRRMNNIQLEVSDPNPNIKNPDYKLIYHNNSLIEFNQEINHSISSRERRYPVITSRFNEDRGTYLHKGIDISLPINTPIKAAFSGKIYKDDQGTKGFGRYVYIIHDGNLVTYYGHLNKWAKFKDGDTVRQGEIIGLSGNTGNSTGPHLHFEVRSNNKAIDPLEVLMPYQIFNLVWM